MGKILKLDVIAEIFPRNILNIIVFKLQLLTVAKTF